MLIGVTTGLNVRSGITITEQITSNPTIMALNIGSFRMAFSLYYFFVFVPHCRTNTKRNIIRSGRRFFAHIKHALNSKKDQRKKTYTDPGPPGTQGTIELEDADDCSVD
jgi:hypothetical protein